MGEMRDVHIMPRREDDAKSNDIVNKHGNLFTSYYEANASRPIVLVDGNEFAYIQCHCCEVPFYSWISAEDFIISGYHQGVLF